MAARNIFLETMGSFSGAADTVMGLAAKQQALTHGSLENAKLQQQIQYDELANPMRLELARETIASQFLDNTLKHFSLINGLNARQTQQAGDATLIKALTDLVTGPLAELRLQLGLGPGQAPPGATTPTIPWTPPTGGPSVKGRYDIPAGAGLGVGQGVLGNLEEMVPSPNGSAAPPLLQNPPADSPPAPDEPPAAGTTAPEGAAGPEAGNASAKLFSPLAPDNTPVFGEDGNLIAQGDTGDAQDLALGAYDPSLAMSGPGLWATTKVMGDRALDSVRKSAAAVAAKANTPSAAPVNPFIPPPVPDYGSMPKSLWVRNQLDGIVLAFGGPEGMQKRYPGGIQAVNEAMWILDRDPAAIKWKEDLETATINRKNANMVIGKALSANLPLHLFWGAIQAALNGQPTDPKTVDEMIKSEYAKQEKRIDAGMGDLTGYSQDPNLAPYADAAMQLAAGSKSKEGAANLLTGMNRFLATGNTEAAGNIIFRAALENAPPDAAKNYYATGQMMTAMNTAAVALNEYYKKFPGKTGPWTGRSLTDLSKDVPIGGLETDLVAAQADYQRAVSGLTVNDKEREILQSIFPKVTKSKDLNDEQMQKLWQRTQKLRMGAVDEVLGDIAPALAKNRMLPPGARLGVPVHFETDEERKEALERGILKEGMAAEVDGVIYPVQRKKSEAKK